MRRALTAVALALGLLIGPAALPAAAHHTHNATTLCSQTNNTGYPLFYASYVTFYSNGHPYVVRCQVRAGFGVYYCYRLNIETHHKGSLYRC